MPEPHMTELKAPAEAFVDTAALAVLIRGNVRLHLLDARTLEYDDGRRIPGGRLLPADAAESHVKRELPNTGEFIVTYCTNLHCPLSSQLAGRLRKMGYRNVLDYPDGLAGWIAAGYPVERRDEKDDASSVQNPREDAT